jgi:hypothetical protein
MAIQFVSRVLIEKLIQQLSCVVKADPLAVVLIRVTVSDEVSSGLRRFPKQRRSDLGKRTRYHVPLEDRTCLTERRRHAHPHRRLEPGGDLKKEQAIDGRLKR